MKAIKALIQPSMLERVMEALHELKALPEVTVFTAHAVSAERGLHAETARSILEIIVPAERVEELVRVIQTAAHTGNPEDGRIFVLPVEGAVEIRTGERGQCR